MRQVIIYHGEDGYWITECQSLPGCISQGKTKQVALNNMREAIEVYIEALKDDKRPVPKDKFDALIMAV